MSKNNTKTMFMVVANTNGEDTNCAYFQTHASAEAQANDMNNDEIAKSEGWTYRVEEIQV